MNDINEALKTVIIDADEALALNELGEKEHSFSLLFQKKMGKNVSSFFRNGKYVGKKRTSILRGSIAVACAFVMLIAVAFNAEGIGALVLQQIWSFCCDNGGCMAAAPSGGDAGFDWNHEPGEI